MSQRKGFYLNSNSYREAAREYIGNLLAMDLLEELVSNQETYHPSNKVLSQRLRKSLATVKRGLLQLETLGLIVRTGKPTYHGYKRTISVPKEVRLWVTQGETPAWVTLRSDLAQAETDEKPGIQESANQLICDPLPQLKNELITEYLNEPPSERDDGIQEIHNQLISEPSKEKQQKHKQAKQEEKVALLAFSCDEESFELPPQVHEKPERTEMAFNALSRKQTSNHTQNERKSRGEPVKGLPDALANKIAQYKADDLWKAMDLAELTMNSKIRLYELALKHEVTPAEFKLMLDKALQRNAVNLGGLLYTMLQQDVEQVRRQAFIAKDQETAQARLDALYANAYMVADWIRLAPPEFKYGSLNKSKTKWIFNDSLSITLTCSSEEVLQQLNNLERNRRCTH